MRSSSSWSPLVLSLAFFAVLGMHARVRAQVAVVTTLPEPDPGQRDVAAGIVAVAAGYWQLLSPPLHPDVTAACRTDTACMLQAARARGATHLLVVSVAGVGRRDHVVALQVFDADGRSLLDHTAIVPGGDEPAKVGAGAAAVLLRVQGPPRAPAKTTPSTGTASADGPPTDQRAPPTSATTGWTVAGVSLIAAGALTATSTTSLAAFGALPADDAGVITASGAAVVALLGVAGLACVVVDGG